MELRDDAAADPNSLFAMLTKRQMRKYGLERSDYGHLVVAQRQWASGNPLAAYRAPLTMEAYLNAPLVADPLRRFDCVPIASGASVLIISAERCRRSNEKSVRVRALRTNVNFDNQEGDGLQTGVAQFANDLWAEAEADPADMDLYQFTTTTQRLHKQLDDLGLVKDGDIARFARDRILLVSLRVLSRNTSPRYSP